MSGKPKVWLEVWPGPTHKKCACGAWAWRSVERARRAVERGDVTGRYIIYAKGRSGHPCWYGYHVVDSVRRGWVYWLSSREGDQGWSVML